MLYTATCGAMRAHSGLRRLRRPFSTLPSPLPIPYIHQSTAPGFPTQLYSTGPDTFLADIHTLWTPRGARGVYGGHVLATAMLAAERTLPPACAFPMHSLHGYFLRPGNSALPTTYHVERLREGRSFCTRSVTVRQGSEAIFTLLCSFHAQEPQAVLGHQVQMPACPGPAELLERAGARSGGASLAAQAQLPLRTLPCLPRDGATPEARWPARYLAWMECAPLPPPTPASAHLHRAALAFAADWGIGVTSLLPYNLQWNSPHLSIAASLDHAMYFHDSLGGGGGSAAEGGAQAQAQAQVASPIRRLPSAPPLPAGLCAAPPQHADRFVLFEMESSVLRGSRGMNSCRIWAQDGTLLCTAVQESLLRAR